jgi:vitamin B12 transporter
MKKAFLSSFFFLLSLLPLSAQEAEENGDFPDFGESPRELSITGTPETTQQMTVIDKETTEKSGARDLAALLEEEIDMSVTRYGGYGNKTEMNLRGFDTERIAILIDGVPANSPRSGEFDISQIDLNNVERIEVIYGGSDTKYNVSGALGGVINIITIKKQKPGLNLGFTLSNTGYMPGEYNMRHAGGAIGKPEPIDLLDMQSLNLFAGYGAEQFSWKASLFGNRAGNHYLYEDDYGFARRKISNEALDGGGNAQFMFALPKDATILSDTKLYYARRNFPITMNSTGSALATDLLITENVMFAAPVIFRDDLATEASLTYQTSITTFGSDYSSGNDHYLTGINRWSWFPVENITLRSGVDWRFLYINTDSPTELDLVKTGNQGGLYVTAEYKLLKNLLLVGSVKGVTDTKQAAAVPKLGLSWKAHPVFTLKNNYFRSFKFPDFDDLYYDGLDNMFAGNPNLKPEDGWGTDLIGEIALEKYFSVVSTVFWQWTTDSIHWVKQGGRWRPENIGTACFTGADFRPVFTLPLEKGNLTAIKIGANYQFQFSWLLNSDLDFANSFRIPYMPAHIIGGSVDLAWKTGSLFISAHYETTRYADTMNKMPLDPYCVINATVNQKAGEKFTFFASLRNVLNAQYESFASYYMPGISLVLGARAKFDFPKGD